MSKKPTVIRGEPEWVLDADMAKLPPWEELTWHRVNLKNRTRTLCRKIIRPHWTFSGPPYKGYTGPADELRCKTCEAKAEATKEKENDAK